MLRRIHSAVRLEQRRARGLVGLTAGADREMIRPRERPQIPGRRPRERDVDSGGAPIVHVVAARDRQRIAGKWLRDGPPDQAVGAVCAHQPLRLDPPAAGAQGPARAGAVDCGHPLRHELGAGAARGVEQRSIEQPAGAHDQRGHLAVRVFERHVGPMLSVGKAAGGDGGAAAAHRVRQRPQQLQGPRAQAAAARLLARMTAVDDRHPRSRPRQMKRRPRAGGAAADDGDMKVRHAPK